MIADAGLTFAGNILSLTVDNAAYELVLDRFGNTALAGLAECLHYGRRTQIIDDGGYQYIARHGNQLALRVHYKGGLTVVIILATDSVCAALSSLISNYVNNRRRRAMTDYARRTDDMMRNSNDPRAVAHRHQH